VTKNLLRGKSTENNADIFAFLSSLAETERALGNASEAAMWVDAPSMPATS